MNSKIYRCGWCGTPTESNGKTLEGEILDRVYSVMKKYSEVHTEATHGSCCEEEAANHMNYEY